MIGKLKFGCNVDQVCNAKAHDELTHMAATGYLNVGILAFALWKTLR
jgi:hypothetical protein